MAIKDDVLVVRERLNRMCPGGKTAHFAAQRLVMDSAYWYRHPRGPAKAPKHHERVTSGAHGWEIEFGANAFLVGLAIERGCRAVQSALAVVEVVGQKTGADPLRESLERAVRGSVANFSGDEYPTLWGLTSGHMLFGAQSIHLGEFVQSKWSLLKLHLVAK